MKKSILALSILLLICCCSDNNKQKLKAPTRVKTVMVSHNSVENQQTYVGIIEEREGTAVSFTSMGIVKRIPINEGQFVSKGQVIAEIDDTQARNLLNGAKAQMEQANDAFKRYKMLYENGSLPEVQWVEIQSKVAQAKAQFDVAQKNLADCQLIAPVSGFIGRKQIGVGETVLPSQAVVNILDINTVKVKVSVPEAEISRINPQTPSSIRVDAIEHSYQGGRIEKGIQADALTHTYDIRIHVENSDHKLLPGMVASVSFLSSSAQPSEQITLPITSVQKKADGSLFVWTIDKDSTVHRTTVHIGNTQGNHISVTSGLQLGQRVVTEGYQKLNEGTKVIY